MKMTMKAAAAAVMAVCAASAAHAAGFMLTEQSAGALGRAYAGVGVDGTDLSGVYYNPATMTLHPGTQIQAGFVAVGWPLREPDRTAMFLKTVSTTLRLFLMATFRTRSATVCGLGWR